MLRYPPPVTRFRLVVGVLALVFAILGLWIAVADFVSPPVFWFPTTPDEAERLASVRPRAVVAARIGSVRGDLWAAAAIASAAPVFSLAPGTSNQQLLPDDGDQARRLAERAARLSPHDARIWLTLSALALRFGSKELNLSDILKLSYYTAPNELSLALFRLWVVVQSTDTSDEELQSLVRLDIQRIVMQRPNLKPGLALVYENAPPQGRETIAAVLQDTDPDFLATLKARTAR